MSEKTTCPSKGIWSKVLAGAFAFAVLAAVPVLALPVLGADVFSLAPAAGEVVQNPLTFDAPTTKLLKLKPAPSASSKELAAANADALLLNKWKYSFDLLTALELGGLNVIVINTGSTTTTPSDTTLQLTLITALFAQQAMLLANASPSTQTVLLQLFTQQNNLIAALLGLPPTTVM